MLGLVYNVNQFVDGIEVKKFEALRKLREKEHLQRN